MVSAADIFHPDRCLVQIAGIVDKREARMLQDCGVDLLGFPVRLPHGGEDLSEETAEEIIRSLNPETHGVVITYLGDGKAIYALCRELGASIVQIHGNITADELQVLRRQAPDLIIVKTLIVRGDNLTQLIEETDRVAEFVDAFLTDTFDERTLRWGATGTTHDWTISRCLIEYVDRPIILAGGLTPDNVRRAVLEVRPAGVDAHTGVEGPDGRKDRRLVERFVSEARDALGRISDGATNHHKREKKEG